MKHKGKMIRMGIEVDLERCAHKQRQNPESGNCVLRTVEEKVVLPSPCSDFWLPELRKSVPYYILSRPSICHSESLSFQLIHVPAPLSTPVLGYHCLRLCSSLLPQERFRTNLEADQTGFFLQPSVNLQCHRSLFRVEGT